MKRLQIVVSVAAVSLVAAVSNGCSSANSNGTSGIAGGTPASAAAPAPAENPSAHVSAVFKVTPQRGFVDTVKATGEWYVGNHACAPLQEISGARMEKIVHSPAGVQQQGESFIVTALSDQFDQGDCHWIFMGLAIHLLKDGRTVGNAGASKGLLQKYHGQLQIICNPGPGVPSCVYPEAAKRTFLRLGPKPGVFSFTIEGGSGG
jgi:hypothetical protein